MACSDRLTAERGLDPLNQHGPLKGGTCRLSSPSFLMLDLIVPNST